MNGPRIIDLNVVCDHLHARGVAAYVEYTGGGCATIYAGEQYLDEEGERRYQAVAGPGYWHFGGVIPVAPTNDFYIGPDDDGESEFVGDGEIACDRTISVLPTVTSAEVADLIAQQVAVCRYRGGDDVRELLVTRDLEMEEVGHGS